VPHSIRVLDYVTRSLSLIKSRGAQTHRCSCRSSSAGGLY